MEKTNIFIAYSREDEQYLNRLKKDLVLLERKGEIKVWYDGLIDAGTIWNEEIKTHLHAADLILLLVSSNSLASDYFWNQEMKDALARHERKEAVVVPVILRHCGWEETVLKDIQALPKNGKPITAWSDDSAAYYSVFQGINNNVKRIQKQKKQTVSYAKPSSLKPTKSTKTTPISQNKNNNNFGKILKIALPVLIGITAIIGIANWVKNQPTTDDSVTDTTPFTINDAATKPPETINNNDDVIKKAAQEAAKKERERLAEIQKQKDEKRENERLAAEQQERDEQAVAEANARQKAEKEIQDNYNNFLKKAKNKYDTGDYSGAKAFYEAALTYIPDGSRALSGIAQCEKALNPPSPPPPSYPAPIQDLINDMVRVQGGDFTMGSNDYDDEKPPHTVTLSSFNIGKYEVTQAQWQAVMGSNPSHFKDCGGRCPVENVSWEDVQEFIKKLNQMTEEAFRLPTEAEWEYAARGRRTKGYTYAGSDDIESVAWYYGNSGGKDSNHPDYGTQTVGTKNPNELGLYDMSGNVYEWCNDWYDKDYYKTSPRNNPKGPSGGAIRVLRGGGWYSIARGCRVSYRIHDTPDGRDNIIGFRLVSPVY